MFWLAYKRKDSSNEAFPFILEVTCLSRTIFKLIKNKRTKKPREHWVTTNIKNIHYTYLANSDFTMKEFKLNLDVCSQQMLHV